MMISYGYVYKSSSKLLMKGTRIETIKDARKNIKKFWKKDDKKLLDLIFFQKYLLGTLP